MGGNESSLATTELDPEKRIMMLKKDDPNFMEKIEAEKKKATVIMDKIMSEKKKIDELNQLKESRHAEGLFASEFHVARIKETPFNDCDVITACTDDSIVLGVSDNDAVENKEEQWEKAAKMYFSVLEQARQKGGVCVK